MELIELLKEVKELKGQISNQKSVEGIINETIEKAEQAIESKFNMHVAEKELVTIVNLIRQHCL